MELLEKRVKSRFSHRQIHLFNQLTLKEYTEIFKQYLQLPDKFVNPKFALNWNSWIEVRYLFNEDAAISSLNNKLLKLRGWVKSFAIFW